MRNGGKSVSRSVFKNQGDAIRCLDAFAKNGECPLVRIDTISGGQPIYGELDAEAFNHAIITKSLDGIPLIPRKSDSRPPSIEKVMMQDVSQITIYGYN